MELFSRITRMAKRQAIRHIGPVRRIAERIASLEERLARADTEITGLKRQLNLIGDRHILYPGYAEALADCKAPEGYDDGYLSRYLARKSKAYLEQLGGQALHLTDHLAHSILAALAVAQHQGSLKVIDFGGGCAIPAALLSHLSGEPLPMQWRVVEVPTLVAATRDLAILNVAFSDDLESAAAELGQVDLVHTAGTLQYVDDPRAWLKRLLAINAPFLFVGRAAFNEGDEDVIGIQRSRIRDHGVAIELPEQPDGLVEYPFTYMPRHVFDAMVSGAGYRMIAAFESTSGFRPVNDFRIVGGGFLYKRGGP